MSIVYSIGDFQGPLEVLLALIEKEQMPISEVSLSRVTQQFLEYIQGMPQFDSDLVSRFLSIAATLIAIKAQSLLPVLGMSEEVEVSVDELEHRLRMYAALKECAKTFDKRYISSQSLYQRPSGWHALHTFVPDATVTVDIISSAAIAVIQRSSEDKNDERSQDELPVVRVRSTKTLEEVIRSIEQAIMQKQYVLRAQEYYSPEDRGEVLISFLAILELVRSGGVHATQEDYSQDIVVIQGQHI